MECGSSLPLSKAPASRRTPEKFPRYRLKKNGFPACKSAGRLINFIHFFAGWWRNWLAHRTVDPVVAGSNPVHPAIQFLQKAVNSQRIRGFLLL